MKIGLIEGTAKQSGLKFNGDCPYIEIHDWTSLFGDSRPLYVECGKTGKNISGKGCSECMELTQLSLFDI